MPGSAAMVEMPNEDDPVKPVLGTRPEYTAVRDHYKVFIRSEPTRIEGETWTLPIRGLVEAPAMLTLAALMNNYESRSEFITLTCISNSIGGDLISTTYWTGVSLQDILRDVRPTPEAGYLDITCGDGFHETVALDLIESDPRIMLTYAWDGRPIPFDHGFPLRIWIPDRYGMKQPKWITGIDVVEHDRPGYWVARGWDEIARIHSDVGRGHGGGRLDHRGGGAEARSDRRHRLRGGRAASRGWRSASTGTAPGTRRSSGRPCPIPPGSSGDTTGPSRRGGTPSRCAPSRRTGPRRSRRAIPRDRAERPASTAGGRRSRGSPHLNLPPRTGEEVRGFRRAPAGGRRSRRGSPHLNLPPQTGEEVRGFRRAPAGGRRSRRGEPPSQSSPADGGRGKRLQASSPAHSRCANSAAGMMSIPSSVRRARGSVHTTILRLTSGYSPARARSPLR